MIENMQLRGLSEKTQESYQRDVRQLAEHYHKTPDEISEDELRQYFLYLKNVRRVSHSSCTVAALVIRFLLFPRVWSAYKSLSIVHLPCFRFIICYNSFRFATVLKGFLNRELHWFSKWPWGFHGSVQPRIMWRLLLGSLALFRFAPHESLNIIPL